MNSDHDFTMGVIKRAVERGATSFSQLLHSSEGMYPAELAALLKSEDILPTKSLMTHDRSTSSANRQLSLPLIGEQRLSLPAPHPLERIRSNGRAAASNSFLIVRVQGKTVDSRSEDKTRQF